MGGLQFAPSDAIRVSVVDATRMNSQLMANALKRPRHRFDVQSLHSNSAEAVRELLDSPPDVAIVSTRLEDGPLMGFRVLNELQKAEAKILTVMLLDSTERDLVVDAFRSGARGVFCRGSSIEALPKCIRQVHQGQIWVSNLGMEFLVDLIISTRPIKIQPSGGMARLTERERDVVRLVTEGMRNQEIAERLHLSEHTVRNYLIKVFDKLGVSTRVELVLYAHSCVGANPLTSLSSESVVTSCEAL
jgi:DNA-binding NarL/FixJ family response regulator